MITHEIPWMPPAQAALAWADQPYLAWLDSAAATGPRCRYSYIAASPFKVLTDCGATDCGATDGFAALAAELLLWRLPPGSAPVPFAGGAIGFLGYGMAARLERLPARHGSNAPRMRFGLYDLVLAFDHLQRRAWVLSSGFPASGPARQRRAAARAAAAVARLRQASQTPAHQSALNLPPVRWAADVTRAEYQSGVAKILAYIAAGDIFQANYTTGFRAARPTGLSALTIHLALRAASPAPFGAFLQGEDPSPANLSLASMSPERFVSLDPAGLIETRPIKGTRPRGATTTEDARLTRELAASAKDQAENLMIVDLMRSDIGRVAAIGSVAVPSLGQVESFASLHHLVSVVSARLRPGLGPVDLLRAAFPAGSITGAPKLRAMEIIDEVEAASRGAYCGIIGWIGFDGAMDTSVTIRTISITPDTLIAQAGGGIVADSVPAEEYDEMRLKLRPLLTALGPEPP